MLQLFVGDISNSLEDGSSHATDVDVDVDDGRETESM